MSSLSTRANIPYGQINDSQNAKQFASMTGDSSDEVVDVQQPANGNILHRIFRSRFRQAATRLWLLEWLSWLVALIAVFAIVGVLVACDGMAVPDWPYEITVSALVSLLATIMTVCLVEPISSGIGQARWIWFTEERRMADFDVLDSATRGPFGAAMVIARGKGGAFGLAGAMLTILTLAIQPFVQQVIQYETKTINSTTAAVPIASQYVSATEGGFRSQDVDLTMKGAIQRGILDITANETSFNVLPQCSTSNCTWSMYQTLAVCGQCADLSSQVTLSTSSGNGSAMGQNVTSLPNGVTLTSNPSLTNAGLIAMKINTTREAPNLAGGTRFKTIAYPDIQDPILDVFTLIAQYADENGSGTTHGPFASECILHFCIQSRKALVADGVFSEQEEGARVMLNDSAKNLQEVYAIDNTTWSNLQDYIDPLWPVEFQMEHGFSSGVPWPNDASQSLFYWINSTSDHLPTPMFDNVAASMTSNIRTISSNSSQGVAQRWESVINVEWPWMTLAFLLQIFVGLYLCAITVATSRRGMPPWKTSSLAVLTYGLADKESWKHFEGAQGMHEMEDIAKRLKLKAGQNEAKVSK